MKKQHIFAMLLTFVATMAGLFLTSCSDGGDEPEAGKSAQEIYDWNVARIVAEDGSINLYSDTENESLYYLPASSREEASTFCATYSDCRHGTAKRLQQIWASSGL